MGPEVRNSRPRERILAKPVTLLPVPGQRHPIFLGQNKGRPRLASFYQLPSGLLPHVRSLWRPSWPHLSFSNTGFIPTRPLHLGSGEGTWLG